MKILFLSELFWPYIGGAERLASELIMDLHKQGHQLLVITSHDQLKLPDQDNYHGIPIQRLAFRESLKNGKINAIVTLRKQFKKMVENFEPDLIHLYQLGTSVFYQLDTLRKHSAPLVVTLHNDLRPSQIAEENSIFLQTFKIANWVCSCSQSALDQVLKLEPALGARSSLIYNGFNIPECSTTPFPAESMRLLCLGRAVYDKGFDLAILAIKAIVDRFPDVHLTIAGDGPERTQLEELTARLNLAENVDFMGLVAPENVPALFKNTAIVLMPSRREGLPVVALEAACAGRPIIAARTGGLAEFVVDKTTGLLIDRENSDQLSKSLIRLLTKPALAEQMGIAARLRVREQFSWQSYLDAHLSLYLQLCPGN